MQRPPIYSALKQGGQPLYKLARKGQTADIPARPIEIMRIDALTRTPRNGCLLRVACGRGTYIRTLCHDIGQALACPAHMRFLLREQTGAFDLSTAVTIEQIKAAGAEGTLGQYLIAPDAPLPHLARYDVPERYAKLCMNGRAPARGRMALPCALRRLYAPVCAGQVYGNLAGRGGWHARSLRGI